MFNKNERFNRWSIRKVTVGAASVIVASGVFFLVGGSDVHAAEVSGEAPAMAVVSGDASTLKDGSMKVEVANPSANTATMKDKIAPTSEISTAPKNKEVALDGNSAIMKDREITASENTSSMKVEATAPSGNTTMKDNGMVEKKEVEITTPAEVQKAVAENTKTIVDVPARYLEKANFPGPFTAGVNQVIPYEFFGGDGMLTRLILKSSDKAPWSDNGVAKNPALLPLEKLANGQYFYEVDLDGVAKGKSDKELLDILKNAGTQSYKAVIKVYAEKDGKADLSHLVATKELVVKLNKEMMNDNHNEMDKKDFMMNENNSMMNEKHEIMDKDHKMMSNMMEKDKNMMTKAHKVMNNKMMLPKTTANTTSQQGIIAGLIATFLAFFGLKRKGNN